MRIAFIFGKALPYRLAFFHNLSQNQNIDLFLSSKEPDTEGDSHLFYTRYRCVSLPFLKKYGSYGYGNVSLPIDLGFKLFKKKYDLIISKGIGTFATYLSFLISTILQKPFILWDETWYYPMTLARIIVMPIFKTVAKSANAIIVPGSKSREFFISMGIERSRIFIAPNASRKLHVIPQKIISVKKRLKIENKRVVLYFGRLIRRKGCQFLIRAFSQLQRKFNNSFLLIAGDGPYKDELEDLCKRLNVKNVNFLGYVPEEEKASIFSLADVFILPSIRTSITAEIWGIVLNEAMFLGKPIIATDAVGAAYDLIEEGSDGFIVKERSVHDLYIAISKIISDEDQRVSMGRYSKELVTKKFSMKNMIQGFVQAIEYVMKDRL
jgi:glycosyltransferase involved in cell wall biosynthesis